MSLLKKAKIIYRRLSVFVLPLVVVVLLIGRLAPQFYGNKVVDYLLSVPVRNVESAINNEIKYEFSDETEKNMLKYVESLFTEFLMMGFFICVIFALVIVIIYFIMEHIHKKSEIKELIQREQVCCREQNQSLVETNNEMKNLVSELAISNQATKHILADDKIDDLEGHVRQGKSIYIFTANFILENKPDFFELIMLNFKKGVNYKYIVSEDAKKEYIENTVKKWFSDYTCFLNSLEEAQKQKTKSDEAANIGAEWKWDNSYVKQIDEAIKAFKNKSTCEKAIKKIRNDCFNKFSKSLTIYAHERTLFYVTVAMYQKSEGTDEYDIIIKLPTTTPKKHFIAFLVPAEKEKLRLLSSMQKLASDDKRHKFELKDVYDEE